MRKHPSVVTVAQLDDFDQIIDTRSPSALPNVVLCGGPAPRSMMAQRWRPVRTNYKLDGDAPPRILIYQPRSHVGRPPW